MHCTSEWAGILETNHHPQMMHGNAIGMSVLQPDFYLIIKMMACLSHLSLGVSVVAGPDTFGPAER